MTNFDEVMRVSQEHGHDMVQVRVSATGNSRVYECSHLECEASFAYDAAHRVVVTHSGVDQQCPWGGAL